MPAAIAAASLALALAAGRSPTGPQKARELTQRSLHEYDSGQFEKALADAEAAFAADPLPAFLFNMAQCQRALHEWEKAEFLYRRYLARAPRAKNRRMVEALIAAVQARQGKTPDASAPQLPELQAVPLVPSGAAEPEADRVTATAEPGFLVGDAPVVVVRDDGPGEPPGSAMLRGAWIGAWTTLGLFLLGSAAGIVSRVDYGNAQNTPRPLQRAQEPGLAATMSAAADFGAAADGLWIAAGAGAVTTAVLAVVAHRQATAPAGVALAPAPAGAGIGLAGRF